jgi:hypothetical protein
MRGAPKAPRRDTRSPFLISRFRWRRDCLERRYITRRCASSVRWSTKDRAAPRRRSLRMSSRVLVCSAPEHSHELPPAADNRPAIPCGVSRRHALRDRFRKALPFPVPPIISKRPPHELAASLVRPWPCRCSALALAVLTTTMLVVVAVIVTPVCFAMPIAIDSVAVLVSISPLIVRPAIVRPMITGDNATR